jgi:hypothetical protein
MPFINETIPIHSSFYFLLMLSINVLVSDLSEFLEIIIYGKYLEAEFGKVLQFQIFLYA